MRKIVLVLGLAGMMAGCQTQVPPAALPTVPVPQTASVPAHEVVVKSVVAAEQALTVVERIALAYVSLPRCGRTEARLCSDSQVVARIRDLDQRAFDAVMAARRNQGTVEFAWAAVEALRAFVAAVR